MFGQLAPTPLWQRQCDTGANCSSPLPLQTVAVNASCLVERRPTARPMLLIRNIRENREKRDTSQSRQAWMRQGNFIVHDQLLKEWNLLLFTIQQRRLSGRLFSTHPPALFLYPKQTPSPVAHCLVLELVSPLLPVRTLCMFLPWPPGASVLPDQRQYDTLLPGWRAANILL